MSPAPSYTSAAPAATRGSLLTSAAGTANSVRLHRSAPAVRTAASQRCTRWSAFGGLDGRRRRDAIGGVAEPRPRTELGMLRNGYDDPAEPAVEAGVAGGIADRVLVGQLVGDAGIDALELR